MSRFLFSIPLLAASLAVAPLRAQGPLNPPGPPSPTMKSLDQIEPRTPVSSLPFVITQPGSYYFTGNLQFTAGTGHAITIQSSDVTLDLNGFTLSSTAAVTGNGIHLAPGFGNHRIRNGSILGTTAVTVTTTPTFNVTTVLGGFDNGITARGPCQISGLTLSGCRISGFDGFFNTGTALCENLLMEQNGSYGARGNGVTMTIRRSTANRNGSYGIFGFSGVQDCSASLNGFYGVAGGIVINSTAHYNRIGLSGSSVQNCAASYNDETGIIGTCVSQCTASSNRGNGIHGEVVSDCNANGNKENGFLMSKGTTIRNSLAFNNLGSGIQAGAACAVIDNTVLENATGITVTIGCTVAGNTCSSNIGHGISAGSENHIRGNTCDKNGTGAAAGAGIHTTGGDNRIDGNSCTENDRGLHITNSGSLILRNTCASSSLVNYEIAATNRVGVIVNASATTSPAISGNSGGAGVGSDNPWANFSF